MTLANSNAARLMCAALSMAFLAASILVARLAAATEAPNLLASSSVHHFGTLRQNTEVVAEFAVSNGRRKSVKIIHTISHCDCTVVDLGQSVLGPSESTTARVRWNTGARRGKGESSVVLISQAEGERTKEALELRVAADIASDFKLAPDKINFAPNDRKACVKIVPSLVKDIRAINAYCTRKEFSVEIAPSGRELTVHRLGDSAQNSLVGADLVIETNAPRCPECRVPIDWGGVSALK